MRLQVAVTEKNERLGSTSSSVTKFSVSQRYGVIPSDELENRTMQAKSLNNYKVVGRDDLVLNRFNAYKGALGLSPGDGVVSPDYFVAKVNTELAEPRFIRYFLLAHPSAEVIKRDMGGMGSGDPDSSAFARFDVRSLLSMEVPVDDVETQRAIADYLDRETAEVDAMSADLDEMEALLTERRRAVLTGTIGTLSNKWPTPQLGTLVQMISGSGFPHRLQKQEGKDLPFYKVGSLSMVNENGVIEDGRNTISFAEADSLGARVVPADSVLLAKIGAALLLARFVRNERPCCIDNNMLALVPSRKIEARYLEHALSRVDVNILERSGPVPTLDLGGLRQHRLPLPPLDEQRRIADEIDRETAEIDTMLADITELRDLLAERRAAVIAAAVTGQIDVPTTQETNNG